MEKKKIILIGPALPLRGGIADSNHSLALALQQLGHQVTMLSFSLQYPSFLFPGKSQFDFNGVKPSVEIHTAINSINPLSWFKTAWWIRKQKPDLLITRFWLPFMGAALGSILKLSGFTSANIGVAPCNTNAVAVETMSAASTILKSILLSSNITTPEITE